MCKYKSSHIYCLLNSNHDLHRHLIITAESDIGRMYINIVCDLLIKINAIIQH